MLLKTVVLSLFALATLHTASAQDIIYKSDGSSEKVKLKEISVKSVTYKRWDNLDGPDFVLPRREVKKIRFENGSEEKFGRDDRLHPVKRSRSDVEYGKNILAVSPVFMTNTSAIGVGISYERIIDKNALFSFHLPVGYSFDNPSNWNDRISRMLWAYPGVKFYPTGNSGKARLGIGPSLAFGFGQESEGRLVFDPNTQTSSYRETTEDIFIMGLMFNMSLNIQPTEHICFGPQFGLGFPFFVDNGDLDDNNTIYPLITDSGIPLVNFGFKIGYRF